MEPDWIWGLAGGGLIGLGGTVLLLGNGQIMGASGILGRLIEREPRDTQWWERLVFVLCLAGVPALLHWGAGITVDTDVTNNALLLVLAGLAVGLGTRTANGCTSGHGVCGISRLSIRGIVATLIYMGSGAATVAILRHMFGAFS